MIKRKTSISINIVSALIILVSLFIGICGHANAWFTAEHKNGVSIIINVGDIKLKLYQLGTTENEKRELYTNDVNADTNTTTKQYVELNGPIVPGEQTELKLKLENKEAGSTPMYVRYQFQLFMRGAESDIEIPVTIAGDNSWSETQTGFKYKSDGYYYYCDTDGNNTKLAYNASVMLMNYFAIEYEDVYTSSGLNYASSNAVYIKLSIDANLTGVFES